MTINEDKSQRPGTTLFRVQYRDKNNKRKRVFYKTMEEAEGFVKKRDAEIVQHGSSIADMNGDDRRSLSVIADLAEKMGCTLQDVTQMLAQKADDSAMKEDKFVSELYWEFAESLNGVVDGKQLANPNLRETTKDTLQRVIQHFYAFKDMTIRTITQDMILDYLHSQEWGVNTKRGRRRELHRFFEWAVEENYREDNPCAMTKRQLAKFVGDYEPPDICTLTPAEVRKVLEACRTHDADLLPFYVTGIFTGVRPTEITGEGGKIGMKWKTDIPRKEWDRNSFVCLETLKVRVGALGAKGRMARTVDIHPCAEAWYKCAGELPPGKNLRRRRDRISILADVELPRNILRHTYASHHAEYFRDESILKTSMGHTLPSTVLYKKYIDISVTPKEAEEFWNLFP